MTKLEDGLTKEKIAELIDFHYPILLGFDLHEGNITFKEYIEKIKEWKNK